MKRKVICILGLFAVLGSLFGCKGGDTANTGAVTTAASVQTGKDDVTATENESGIKSFYYSYNGSVGGGNFSYTVTEKDDGVFFTYESLEDRDYGEMTTEVTRQVLDDLSELCRSCRLEKWDGFHGSDSNMLDGDGFSLSIRFVDGTKISAGGENKYPSGYNEFLTQMREILEPLRDKVREEKHREIISGGVRGTLDCVLATFIQHGDSGRDEYHVLITAGSIRSLNFDVQVRSVSGEVFPVGEYKSVRNVPDSVIDFTRLQKLIEKYDIIEWLGYEKTAKDPNNSEWYQVELCFGDELTISSMGTEHPKNYKKFRKDFLIWLKETADAVDALPEE